MSDITRKDLERWREKVACAAWPDEVERLIDLVEELAAAVVAGGAVSDPRGGYSYCTHCGKSALHGGCAPSCVYHTARALLPAEPS